ncbi:MAG: TIGR01777 family oxidoreductase [Candidatus Acidiferrales bacterium]
MPTSPYRIVLPGGSGQVGTIIARHVHAQGYDVVVLARNLKRAPWRAVQWDGATLGRWTGELENADVVINLAGRSVNCRYNDSNRREIKESRIRTTRLVGEAISRSAHAPRIWMNASTATIYRDAYDRPMDEATGELGGREQNVPSSWRFSIDVATSWEEAFFSWSTPGTRKIALRSAMVMSPGPDGIFDTLLSLVRHRLGGTSGSGRQFVSWIHEHDFLRAIEYLIINDSLDGAVDIASPNPIPNADFMALLRKAWGARVGLPATALMLELGAVFLRTETELILKSRRVVPGRLLANGFQFDFPTWDIAAFDLVKRYRQQINHSAA